MYVCMYACMYVYIDACTYLCIHPCVCVYMLYMLCIYIYTHICCFICLYMHASQNNHHCHWMARQPCDGMRTSSVPGDPCSGASIGPGLWVHAETSLEAECHHRFKLWIWSLGSRTKISGDLKDLGVLLIPPRAHHSDAEVPSLEGSSTRS